MIKPETVREYCLALPETDEAPHFENRAFRVKKKIFATLNVAHNRATLKFAPEMQQIFTAVGQGAISPVPNAWGKHGWTNVSLEKVEDELLRDALLVAWRETAPPGFRKKYPALFEDSE